MMLPSLRWIMEGTNKALGDSSPLAIEKVVAPEHMRIKTIKIMNPTVRIILRSKTSTELKALSFFLYCITFSVFNNNILSDVPFVS
jgi:hypothetical protein